MEALPPPPLGVCLLFLETRYKERCVLAQAEADATGQPGLYDSCVLDEWRQLKRKGGGRMPLEWSRKHNEVVARYNQHRAAYPHLYGDDVIDRSRPQ
jgi:hypothetical protein